MPGNNKVEENTKLNQEEYASRKIVLASYPRTVFVQMDSICNQDCLFCSRDAAYSHFDIDEYRERYGRKLQPVFERAESIILTGSGELLALPGIKESLDYFNGFAHAEKMFATNGSTLTPKMADYINDSGNRYTIHVSLHASNGDYHRMMTKSGNFDLIIENLKHLRSLRANGGNVRLNMVFLLTAKNIDNLVEFVHFAKEYGADSVIAYYNYIYRQDQRDLSCFFIKEKTNDILLKAGETASRVGMRITLPPKFGQDNYREKTLCGEAWSQIMINCSGDIITCDVAGDSRESILNKEFMDVWNGEYFTGIRKKLADGDTSCAKYCFRANPAAVNDFRSHIITRGKTEDEIKKVIEG